MVHLTGTIYFNKMDDDSSIIFHMKVCSSKEICMVENINGYSLFTVFNYFL